MSMVSDMAKVERLARQGYSTDQIIGLGVQVAPQTVAAIVENRRQVLPRPAHPKRVEAPSPQEVIAERVAAWRRRYLAAAGESYRIITVIAPEPSLRQVVDDVCAAHGVARRHLIGPSRVRSITYIRHEAMYAAAVLTGKSLAMIGHAFGDRDHTTVIHAVRAHAARHGLTPPRGMTAQRERGRSRRRSTDVVQG